MNGYDKVTLKMEKGRLVLELPHNALDLEVNGQLAASYFLGVSQGPEDLRTELRKANAAVAACAMLRNQLRAMERTDNGAEQLEGFRLGLLGDHRVVAGHHVPPEGMKGGRNAMLGWDLGYAVRAALAIAGGEADPRLAPE